MTSTIDGPERRIDPLTNRLGERMAAALEKLAGTSPAPCDLTAADAFVFSGETTGLAPILRVNRVDIALLRGIDTARDTLLANTERFARGFAANNSAYGLGFMPVRKKTILRWLLAMPAFRPPGQRPAMTEGNGLTGCPAPQSL